MNRQQIEEKLRASAAKAADWAYSGDGELSTLEIEVMRREEHAARLQEEAKQREMRGIREYQQSYDAWAAAVDAQITEVDHAAITSARTRLSAAEAAVTEISVALAAAEKELDTLRSRSIVALEGASLADLEKLARGERRPSVDDSQAAAVVAELHRRKLAAIQEVAAARKVLGMAQTRGLSRFANDLAEDALSALADTIGKLEYLRKVENLIADRDGPVFCRIGSTQLNPHHLQSVLTFQLERRDTWPEGQS